MAVTNKANTTMTSQNVVDAKMDMSGYTSQSENTVTS